MTKMNFVSAIRRAAMLGLVALSCLAPMRLASAQVAISGNYYEEFKSVICVSPITEVCQLVFSATPQVVYITDVSCMLLAVAPINGIALGVSDTSTPTGTVRRQDFFVPQLLSGFTYAARFKTSFLFGSGKWPSIIFSMTSGAQADLRCKIVGTFLVP